MCVSLLEPCVLVGLDWVEPMMIFFVAHHMVMHNSCICTFFSLFLVLYVYWCFSTSLSLSLSLTHTDSCAWHLSAKRLPLRTLFVSRHLLLTLLHFISGSMMKRLVRTSRRTSPNMVFIRNAMLSYWTSLIPLYPLSFTVRDGSLFARSRWFVLLWSYKSFTPICTDSIILYLISLLLFRGICIVVISELISNVLHVPLVSHLDYLGCPRLRTVQRWTLVSHLWDTFIVGDR